VQDYVENNITMILGTDPSGMLRLNNVIDPLVYRENFTMPKLVIDATGVLTLQPCAPLSCC
jgi:PhoPQ-activated pathogenicity-related protein